MNILESMTARMMADPNAARAFAAIPANANPADLAATHRSLCGHRSEQSQSAALAIEAHIRNLVVVHFMDDSVRAALATIEETLAAKKKHARKNQQAAVRRRNKRGNTNGNT